MTLGTKAAFGPFLIFAVVAGLLALPVAVWLDLRDLAERMVRVQATEVGHVINNMRDFYASDVVSRVVKAHGKAVPSHRYREIEGGIPVPATLSIELGNRLGGPDEAVGYRFVSDFPFKGRTNHGLDAFEVGALASLRRDASQPIVDVQGTIFDVNIRIASPVVMGPSCVSCHNSHPASPKTDWVVGDVRGIQEISVVRPIAANLFSFKYLLIYFAFASLSGFMIIAAQRRQSRLVQSMNDKLFNANNVLETNNAEIAEQKREIETLYKERNEQNEALENTVRTRTQDLVSSQEKLRKLIEQGIALSAERDEKQLMENILLGAKILANADGGTLYIKSGNDLDFQIVSNSSLNILYGGATGGDVPFAPVKLSDDQSGEPNHSNVVSHAAHTGRTVNIADAYTEQGFDFSGTRSFDKDTGYRSSSFLTVPLTPRTGDVIGVLQLINAKDPETGETIPFTEEIEEFVEALASQAAVALDNQNLLKAQKDLLDSFIELIASAIDAKSAYAGGHCARVPVLAELLAQAACAKTDGPFADFSLSSDQWYEFHIASWLHDCGKVTTPEYVVDKATKLETIYNRIHEIRTRFEIMIRDAQVRCLEGKIAGAEDSSALETARDAEIERLRDEFSFVAACNRGGEFMDAADLTRLQEISARTWLRHLDDSIGLSEDETKRRASRPVVDLPVAEALLADRQDHIVHRVASNPFGDNRWGFRIDVPEHLYNHGEIYNLGIERGTLTPEERFKINDHVIQTIIMLEQLPFPDNMKRVPEYAGGHHETMVGTGYPRKLSKDDMSIPARIMAIADIFEALTDSNRPYKKGKTLTEALGIMGKMTKGGHIDTDLFNLFLTSGAYREYSETRLETSQLNDVTIEDYLA